MNFFPCQISTNIIYHFSIITNVTKLYACQITIKAIKKIKFTKTKTNK